MHLVFDNSLAEFFRIVMLLTDSVLQFASGVLSFLTTPVSTVITTVVGWGDPLGILTSIVDWVTSSLGDLTVVNLLFSGYITLYLTYLVAKFIVEGTKMIFFP